MKTFYVTFGYGHNPGIGYFTTVKAVNMAKVKELMAKEYNSKYTFIYKSKEEAGVDEFNLIHVPYGFKYTEQ